MARQTKDGSFPGDKSTRSARWADYGSPGSSGSTFSWSDYAPADIAKLVGLVTSGGDAISFAVNRPRTGGSITILAGGPPVKFYISDEASWFAAFEEITGRYADA